jgi:mono/diheme cytochrome c family protein
MRKWNAIIPVVAMAVFITACQGGISKAKLESGQKVYTTYCAGCHMENGSGVPSMNAPLAGSAYVAGDKEKLIRIVLKGSAAFAGDPERTYKNPMASMAHLSDNEIADVLTYIRNNFSNTGSAVTPDEVKTVRKKTN